MRDVDRSQSQEAGGGVYIPELCCASAGVRQSLSWAKISSVFRSERCPCSPPSPGCPLFPSVLSLQLWIVQSPSAFMKCGLAARIERGQGGLELNGSSPSVHKDLPPASLSPRTRPNPRRSGAQPKKNHSYAAHWTLTVNQFPPLRNLFHGGET